MGTYTDSTLEAIAIYLDFESTIRVISEYAENPEKILWDQSFWHRKVLRETSGLYVTDTLIRGAWASFYAMEMLSRRPKYLMDLLDPEVFPSWRVRVINEDFYSKEYPWVRILSWDGKIYGYNIETKETHDSGTVRGAVDIYGHYALVPGLLGTEVYVLGKDQKSYSKVSILVNTGNTIAKIFKKNISTSVDSLFVIDMEGNLMRLFSEYIGGSWTGDPIDLGIWTYEPDFIRQDNIPIRALDIPSGIGL